MSGDDLQHCLPISKNIIVPEPQDYKSAIFDPLSALFVAVSLVRVVTAVKFDNQSRGVTIKIYDEGADRLLSAELEIG